jgi:hypothetical protein
MARYVDFAVAVVLADIFRFGFLAGLRHLVIRPIVLKSFIEDSFGRNLPKISKVC